MRMDHGSTSQGWNSIITSPDTSACLTSKKLAGCRFQLPRHTYYMSKTSNNVIRHAMSTDTPRMFSILWDMLDFQGTCWDVQGPSGHPRDTTCPGMLDIQICMSRHAPDI